MSQTSPPNPSSCTNRHTAWARELDDRVGIVLAPLSRRTTFSIIGQAYRDEALANTEEALALSRELGDEELIIDSLTALYRCQRRIFGVTAELEEQAEALLKRIEVAA